MLRSYQYKEVGAVRSPIQNPNFRKKEEEIARKYVLKHGGRGRLNKPCPICGKSTGEYFYTKWGVDYLCCPDCRSVYADVDGDIAKEYQKTEALQELRLDEAYQEDAAAGRTEMWTEFLEWMEMRSFRFIRRNKGLSIIDVGNRFKEYVRVIRESELCGRYDLRSSILSDDENNIDKGMADLVFYVDQMQKETDPRERMMELREMLSPKGLLIIGTRAGSGFDILTLREKNEKIFPYEHIMLPSVKGLMLMLERIGLKVLEITTPGVMDVNYVMESKESLDEREGFVRYLLEESDTGILHEFQRFLQKSCLSSFVRVIACRK